MTAQRNSLILRSSALASRTLITLPCSRQPSKQPAFSTARSEKTSQTQSSSLLQLLTIQLNSLKTTQTRTQLQMLKALPVERMMAKMLEYYFEKNNVCGVKSIYLYLISLLVSLYPLPMSSSHYNLIHFPQ